MRNSENVTGHLVFPVETCQQEKWLDPPKEPADAHNVAGPVPKETADAHNVRPCCGSNDKNASIHLLVLLLVLVLLLNECEFLKSSLYVEII